MWFQRQVTTIYCVFGKDEREIFRVSKAAALSSTNVSSTHFPLTFLELLISLSQLFSTNFLSKTSILITKNSFMKGGILFRIPGFKTSNPGIVMRMMLIRANKHLLRREK